MVVAWPLAQFSSCADPTDVGRAILFGYSRLWGVSHCCGIRVWRGKFAYLDTLWTVGVGCFVGCITIDASNWRVGTGWAFSADRQGTWMLPGLVWACANRTVGVVLAQCSRMTKRLTLATLCASPICNIVVQLALAIADNQVLTPNLSFLDIASECHHNSGIRL